MTIVYNFVVPGLWMILFAVWGIAALRAKKTTQSEGGISRAVHLGMIVLSLLLGLTEWLHFGPLGNRFVPKTPVIVILGLLVELSGIGLAIAARFHLGRNWSARITIKEGHSLIYDGPYALVRHPIYTGWLLALLGSALVYGEWGGLLGCALMLAAYWRKIGIEERFLMEQFGEEYNLYRQKVKALIPYIW
jgi:protein-S-isoprenylcysteine O-methyltransferase Ste14